MAKVITLRYATKCKICRKEIPAGLQAYWYGNRAGAAHVECQKPATKSAGDQHPLTVLKFSDLRRDYIESVESRDASKVLKMFGNRERWETIISSNARRSDWQGCTNAQMIDWLKNGYAVPGLEGVDSTLLPGAPKRKIRFAEEGDEMLIDLAWSGVDEHFMTWDKRQVKPSFRVVINCCFSAYVGAEVVNAYQQWCARMLQTIDSFGFDMQVDLAAPNSAPFHDVAIRVKESGEASDFSNWSPMFSPGGFRHLTFLAFIQACDTHGKIVQPGLGHVAQSNAWSVSYDESEQVLTVTNNNDGREFPEFQMTQSFIAIMQGVNTPA